MNVNANYANFEALRSQIRPGDHYNTLLALEGKSSPEITRGMLTA